MLEIHKEKLFNKPSPNFLRFPTIISPISISLMPKCDWSLAVRCEITGSFKTPFMESSASLSSFSATSLSSFRRTKDNERNGPTITKRINITVKKDAKILDLICLDIKVYAG